MPKFGDIREDGYTYIGQKGGYDYWSSPESLAKKKVKQSEWAKKHRQKIKSTPELHKAYNEYHKEWQLKNRKEKPEGDMLRRVRCRAKRLKLPFNLTQEDIVIPEVCPILWIPLKTGVGIADDNSPELDRIVGSKGYVRGNVIVISRRANRIKNDATLFELQLITAFYTKLTSANR